MSAPVVSVMLCNYNHGRYLRQCLAGLLGQTYQHIEIAFTDDGSTDGSQDIIREFAAKDPRILTHFFPANRGQKVAFADSMNRTTGKYIYSAASDDFVINKDFFKKAVHALENDPRPAGYYGITGLFVAETEKLSGFIGTAEVEGYNTPLQCCLGLLKYRSVVTGPSCILRRNLYLEHGAADLTNYMAKLESLHDHCLNHELAWRYGMIYEKTPFTCQRIYEAKTNYSSNLTVFQLASRLSEMERRLRLANVTYPDIEKDWDRWRAVNLVDFIRKSGIQV